MKINEAMPIFHALLAANESTALSGAPGIGKSELVYQAAGATAWKRLLLPLLPDAWKPWPVMEVRAVLIDPVDLRGIPSIEDGLTRWNPPTFLPDAKRDGEFGILYFDEWNAAGVDPGVQAGLLQLTLPDANGVRRLGEYVLPAGWRIVAAGNRQQDKTGATKLIAALADRFWHIDIEPDLDSLVAWNEESNRIRPEVIAFLQWMEQRGESVLHMQEGSDNRTFPTPRSWEKVSKILDYAGHCPDVMALVAAKIGPGAAAEFSGFLKVWQDLPKLSEVYANPDAAKLPHEPSALFAVASAIAQTLDSTNAASGFRYLERVESLASGSDFAAMAITKAVRRNPDLKATSGFTNWAVANPDITF